MSKTILDYIGLKLTRLSTKLKSVKPDYKPFNSGDNVVKYKVYKRVNIKKLQVLVSDTDRTTDITERFKEALPLQDYIKQDKEAFEAWINKVTQKDIKDIEKQQEQFEKQLPYFIKYDKNYLWQIYYSKEDDKYFMLVPARETENQALAYVIKKKLEDDKADIFVPICKEEISETYFTGREIEDIVTYIKLFTNQWPEIVEVQGDKENTLYIMGETKLKDNFSTKYRTVIKDIVDAKNFYTVLKALYVLATETNYLYKFDPGIDEKGNFTLSYDKQVITIKNIQEFISNETGRQQGLKYSLKNEIETNKEKIEKINEILKKQSLIYVKQEKQIFEFMNCKKSVFKRVKYFFRNNKKVITENKNLLARLNEEKSISVKQIKEKEVSVDKQDYSKFADIFTVADLVKNSVEVKKISSEAKGLEADIKVLLLKQENMTRKTDNAQKYLDEIQKHKKNLFDFWRFTNKDNANELAEGQAQGENIKKRPVFNYDEDKDDLGLDVDSLQRQKLSDEECNAVFLAKYILPALNAIVTKSDTYLIDECYDSLKENLKNHDQYQSLFGGIGDESDNIKKLKFKQHRENPRELYSILKFTNDTTLEDFKETCRNYGRLLNEAYNKISCKYDMEIYYDKRNKGFITATINPYELVENEETEKIYKAKTSAENHMLFFSNIIMYNNVTKTLPVGMDETNEVLLKVGDIKEVNKEKINIIVEKDLFNVDIRKVTLIEEAKRQ